MTDDIQSEMVAEVVELEKPEREEEKGKISELAKRVDEDIKKLTEAEKEHARNTLAEGRVKYSAELAEEESEADEKKGKKKGIQKQEFEVEITEKAKEILENGDPLDFILNTIEKYHKGDYHLVALKRCASISPWLNRGFQLHDYGVGGSAKGKTSTAVKVVITHPTENYVVLSELSPKALYYAYRDGELPEKCIIFFDDVRVSEEGESTLKAVTGGGAIIPKLWTVKEMEFMAIALRGVYSVFLTSVNPIKDPQVKGRFVVSNPDESPEQDERVWEHQDKTLRSSSEAVKMERDEDLKICQCMTQILTAETDEVIIPFNIIWRMKSDRRLYPFFITLIKCIAKHYKFQRRKTLDGEIIATKGDFMFASEIWEQIKAFQKTKSNQNASKVLESLYEAKAGDETTALTYSEIAKSTKLSTATVKRACYDLEAMALINTEEGGGRSNPKKMWLVETVKPLKTRYFTTLTEKGVALDGFDYTVKPFAGIKEGERKELELYINTLDPQNGLTVLKKRHAAASETVKNAEKTVSNGLTVSEQANSSEPNEGNHFLSLILELLPENSISTVNLEQAVKKEYPELSHDKFVEALEKLLKTGLIFKPQPSKIQRIQGGSL